MEELRKKLSDPTKFGPLMWYLIHNMSRRLDQDTFIIFFHIIVDLIPCGNCKNHAKEYLLKNPIELFKDIQDENTGDSIGMFKWTWTFHNAVNLRLTKPVVDFDVAIKMYPLEEEAGENKGKEGIEDQCLQMCGLSM